MYIMHVEVGIAEPTSTGPINNIYFCDPWRICKIRNNGTVITLAGYRHKLPPDWEWQASHPDTPHPSLELVGDWSAVPEARRGFRELWGIAWNSDNFPIDPNSANIPLERNLQQHFSPGIVMFVTDTQMKRVCKIQFTYEAHNIQPKVTEHITHYSDTGLPFGEPWDLQEWRDELIVSDRTNNKIVAFDKNTGAFKRTILSKNPALGGALYLDGSRNASRLGSLEQCQAHDCLGPEGLYMLDDWLYFASFVQNQVRRVHLETGVLQVCIPDIATDGNSQYAKIAVSDGTFGPRHSIFVQTWSNAVYADNRAYSYDSGTGIWSRWKINPGSSLAPMTGRSGGSYGWTTSSGYGAAVGCAKGRLVVGSSNEGIRRFSLATATDLALPAYNATLYSTGATEFRQRGLHLQFGTYGFGFYGFPAPYGLSAAIDYFLQWNGVPP
jgi:hypothetical protein